MKRADNKHQMFALTEVIDAADFVAHEVEYEVRTGVYESRTVVSLQDLIEELEDRGHEL